MSDGKMFLFVLYPLFVTAMFVFVAVKFYQLRRARYWPSTEGKVLANRVMSRRNQPGDPGYDFHDTEVTHQPLIEYEYQVDGRTYTSQRFTIGERTSGYELLSILERHPVGATVTVYYDPADPQTAVLERDVPWWMFFVVIGFLAAIFIVAPLMAALFYYVGVAGLRTYLANPSAAPLVVVTAGAGLMVLLFAFALTRMVWQAQRWPIATGRIVHSGIETVVVHEDARHYTQYRAAVVYRYEVNGREFLGDRLQIALVISLRPSILARKLADQYPVGKEVNVYYNPENPGESVLNPHTRLHYVLWLMALAFFGSACALAM